MGNGASFILEITMNIEQILHLVQEANAAGKRLLPLGNGFLSVKRILDGKAEWEFHVTEACKHLAQYHEESKLSEYSISDHHMRYHAMHSGSCFCIYLRDLGLLIRLGDNPPIPAEVSADAELQRQWEIGFNFAKAQMYRDPD
jgi:hypothetical protein